MSQAKTATTTNMKTPSPNKRSLEEYQQMTTEELIATLQQRDNHIGTLENECKRLKTVTPPAKQGLSPEQLQANVGRLRQLIHKGIKSQMKWKPSCKTGKARFSYEGICDEATFRAFMKLTDKEKSKGKRMEAEDFQKDLLGDYLYASIRYGSLELRGKVNVSIGDNTIKITGGYGV